MEKEILFRDREDAGKKLALVLIKEAKKSPIVLGLARGGVIVASEVAKLLHAPLDVLIVRKIGSPQNPEFGIGAISEGGIVRWDMESISRLGIGDADLEGLRAKEEDELDRRIIVYRKGRSLPDMRGKTVIIVDDGVATGVTAKVAIETVQKLAPSEIVFASPVCSFESYQDMRKETAHVMCMSIPSRMQAIGKYYKDFHQVTDGEVLEALRIAKETRLKN